MPPKKADKGAGGAKKPSATKLVEDRTFGMKNKKGAQTQKAIAQMTRRKETSGREGSEGERKGCIRGC
jgi:hypothetical protein